jgi:hypothetical protein
MELREVPKIYTRDRMAGARLRCWLIAVIAITAIGLIGWLGDNPPMWPGTVLAFVGGWAVQRAGYWSGRLAEHDARLAAIKATRAAWLDRS